MATRQYDWDPQSKQFEITESVGGAISNTVRVTIDLAKATSRQQVLSMMEWFENHLKEAPWPPA